MRLLEQLPLWNEAAINVLDVQRIDVLAKDGVQQLQLKSSMILFVSSGQGLLQIDRTSFKFAGFFICHADKGSTLRLTASKGAVQCYSIAYTAVLPRVVQLEPVSRSSASVTPSMDQSSFGFAPAEPFALHHMLQLMHDKWSSDSLLNKFHVKALLHALLYELMEQRQQLAGSLSAALDGVDIVQAYIEAHAHKRIELQQLAVLASCSPRQLQRLFRERLQKGPMEYLIQVRMEKAQRLLQTTSASIGDIAQQVGYQDVYYFSRAFRKYVGISPLQFRQNQQLHPDSHNTKEEHRLLAYSPVVYCAQSETGIILKHMKGELSFKQRPRRIAVLDLQYADQLTTLNKPPAGSVQAAGTIAYFPDYLQRRLTQTVVLGTYEQPNIEAVSSLKPDLIICTEVHEPIYASLAAIAPTAMFKRNEDWRNMLITFGMLVGKEKQATHILQSYEKKTALLSSKLAARLHGQRVALIRPREAFIRVHTAAHRTGAVLYEDLRLPAPQFVANAADTAYHISLDALPNVDANHYFLLSNDYSRQTVIDMQQTDAWNSLEAVKEEHVYTVDAATWIGSYGPLGINRVVEQIASSLLA